ncbi:hypothetical protein [Pseudoalteromonas phage XCL1123]|nr:hypothetical protein [Pseudoalteromonas phage XCL1123]
MRDLTEDELKLAPEWATHYWVHDSKVMFESVDLFQLLNNGELSDTFSNDSGYITSLAVEIKRKPFNISEHEFSCENFKACKPSWIGDDLQVEIIDSDFTHHEALLNKTDAIAIAKALGVTGKDLL